MSAEVPHRQVAKPANYSCCSFSFLKPSYSNNSNTAETRTVGTGNVTETVTPIPNCYAGSVSGVNRPQGNTSLFEYGLGNLNFLGNFKTFFGN